MTRNRQIEIEDKTRAYFNFINSIKSEETRLIYKKCIRKYLNHYKIAKVEDLLLNFSVTEVEKMLVDYLLGLKQEGLSSSYVNLNFCAIKHFYFMNDVVINKEKIGKFLGESKKKNVDRGYTHDEIKKLLDNSDIRLKVVITVLASTGMRKGALTPLKLSQVKKIENEYCGKIYKFTVYENTKEEYFTFCTPECASFIDSYLEYRIRSGEILTDNSYFIREQFDINDLEQIRKHGRPITKDSLINILHALTIKVGLRQVNHQYTGKERTQVPLAHGFRKFWTTQVIHAKINPEIRELLLGHRIGLASAYYRPTQEEMLSEFAKAIDNLTINPENRLKKKITELEQKQSEIDNLKWEQGQLAHQYELAIKDREDFELKINEQVSKLNDKLNPIMAKLGEELEPMIVKYVNKDKESMKLEEEHRALKAKLKNQIMNSSESENEKLKKLLQYFEH